MKSIKRLACVGLLLLTLAACCESSPPAPSLPPQSETPSMISEPLLQEETSAEQAYALYPLYARIEALAVGGGYDVTSTEYILDEQQRSELWQLLRIDEWSVATGLPYDGFAIAFFIREGTQAWIFNCFEGKTLIIPSMPDSNGEKICYFAPKEIIDEVLAFAETLTPSPA